MHWCECLPLSNLLKAQARTTSSSQAALLCLILGLLSTLSLVILTPPFQVPDEPQHFYRAYQIAQGSLWGTLRGNSAGAMLPSSLSTLAMEFTRTHDNAVQVPVLPHPLVATLAELGRPLDPGQRTFTNFAAAAIYSPLGYLPQALGIVIGRAAGAGPLGLISYAVWLMPVRPEVAALAGLLPMGLYEYASASADASVIACAFLVTALGLRCQVTGRMNVLSAIILAGAGTVVCSVKPPYAPLLVIGLSALARRGRDWRLASWHAAIVAVALGVTLAWLASALPLMVPWPQANPAGQLHEMLVHPLHFLAVLRRTYFSSRGYILYLSAIGVLGWFTLTLPAFAYVLPSVGLLLCGLARRPEDARLGWWSIAWNVLMIAAIGTMIAAALYIDWTPLGSPVVTGMQGRYMLPLLPLAGVTFCSALPLPRGWDDKAVVIPAVAIISIVGAVTAEAVLVHAFALF